MGKVANDPRRKHGDLSGRLSRHPAQSTGRGVAVSDLLALPVFAATEVVAGRDGLDRRVTCANVMEVPDIEPWVKPDELLLTTGYPLREISDGMRDLVTSLDRAG